MTEKEACLMCENYSEDTKCDQKDSCKLMAVLKENRELKKKISKLNGRTGTKDSADNIGHARTGSSHWN